ncbi:hypothetical protein GCM10023340_33220 [Nocardioides marinquilinus]|uniref:DUF3618 domain-containing protein n=1 Tax=Nocardioides marinquilinus TaxID=1210400 RepID=A0ABP9PXE0_9ACTN
MGETPDQLTQDIEQTRGRLGDHLDELQDKVSPTAIAGRQKDAAKSRIMGVRDKAMGTARSAGDSTPSASEAADSARQQVAGAPIAAGVVAFGLGMLAAALVPASRAEQKTATQVKDAVQEHAQPLMDDAKQAAGEAAEHLKGSAAESVQQVKDSASDSAQQVKDSASDSAQQVKDSGPTPTR